MLFNSFDYFVFLLGIALLYFSLAHRFRWGLLLAGSYYFYMCWRPEYLVLIVLSTLTSYVGALGIAGAGGRVMKRLIMAATLLLSFGLLFLFKYFDFLADFFNVMLGAARVQASIPLLDLVLPVGISFYTFQQASYVIDVYWGVLPAQRHLGVYALYVSFFPQLVAGPIERSNRFMPQLTQRQQFDAGRVVQGLRLILWGMFKKVVIADNLATWVDTVYWDPSFFTGPALLLATVAFAFQIYCDFSGYSDIAIGSARIFGIELMQNFDRPYLSSSVGEFWQRWHISLSTWFRDYVYIPLGGRRVGRGKWCVNIILVFVLSGFWHGASWTFVIWGALHAAYYLIGALLAKPRAVLVHASGLNRMPRLHAWLRVAWTFTLVCFAWIFFRARDLRTALAVISGLGRGWGSALENSGAGFEYAMAVLTRSDPGEGLLTGVLLAGAIVAVLLYELRMRHSDWSLTVSGYGGALRWAFYGLLGTGVLNFGVSRTLPFQYFQF